MTSRLKIQIASDLHLEYYPINYALALEELIIPDPNAHALALLGDICALGSDKHLPLYTSFLNQVSQAFPVVLILAGNHEYYSPKGKYTMTDVKQRLTVLCDHFDNIHLLDNDSIELQGVKIIGM